MAENQPISFSQSSSGSFIYEEDVPEIPRPPPTPRTTKFRTRHVVSLMEYAQQVLQYEHAKLAPLGLRAMSILNEACMLYIFLHQSGKNAYSGIQDVKEEWREIIAYFASGLDSRPHLLLPPTELDWYIQDSLIALHRGALCARYGEMLAGVCVAIGCEDQITRLWRERRQRADWYRVARLLEHEKQQYYNGQLYEEDCTTYNRIFDACDRIGLDHEETFDLIHEYGFEDRYMDADIITLIKSAKDEDFRALASRIYVDMWSIPALFSSEERIYISLFRTLLETCRDTWFDCASMQDEYYAWPATWYLLNYHGYQDESPNQALPNDSQLRKEIYTDVMRETIRQLLSLQQARSAWVLNEASHYNTISGGRRVSKPEGSRANMGLDMARSMGRDWQRLERLNDGSGEILDTHFETRDGGTDINSILVWRIKFKSRGNTAWEKPAAWQPDGWVEWNWRSALTVQDRLDILPYVGDAE